jgi:ribosomal protein S12 methylthiotransferase accessory factor
MVASDGLPYREVLHGNAGRSADILAVPDAVAAGNSAAIRNAASFLGGMFAAIVPTAPDARMVCGTAEPSLLGAAYAEFAEASVAGLGTHPDRAYERCVGEAIEYLSQLSPDGDPLRQGHGVGAIGLRDDTPATLPAELCLRSLENQYDRIGSGCAAGRDWTEAAAAGLWELIERDALVSWWYDGNPARPLSEEVALDAEIYTRRLRGNAHTRSTLLLDISAQPDLPAVAACSFLADGTGFVAGFAAHADVTRAAGKAIRELIQMEFGLLLVGAKSSAGLPLNEDELRQQRRADEVGTDHPAFRPQGVPRDASPAASAHEALRRGLEAAPGVVYAVDVTRSVFGVPVAKIVAPALRGLPGNHSGVGLL